MASRRASPAGAAPPKPGPPPNNMQQKFVNSYEAFVDSLADVVQSTGDGSLGRQRGPEWRMPSRS